MSDSHLKVTHKRSTGYNMTSHREMIRLVDGGLLWGCVARRGSRVSSTGSTARPTLEALDHTQFPSVPRQISNSSTTQKTQRRPGGGQFNYQLTQSYLSLDPCVNLVQRVLLKATEGKD